VSLTLRPASVRDSLLARWDARWKLLALVLLAAAVAALRQPGPALAAVGVAGGLAALGRVRPMVVAARAAWLAVVVVPFVVVLPFTDSHGLTAAAGVLLRCVAIGLLVLVAAHTTTVAATMAAATALRLPGRLVATAQLAVRYSSELFTDARRIRRAMQARGLRLRPARLTHTALGHLAGAVIVRGGERAERVSAAMAARGFDGRRMCWG
jgi:cobalt/nickel transport system permease protein